MDLGDDEVLLFILSGLLALFSVTGWIRALRLCFQRKGYGARVVLFSPFLCLAFVLTVLLLWADDEVRRSPVYIFLLMVLAVGWLGVATSLFRWLGVSLLDDAADRNNPAALVAWSGGIVGITLVFGGGNVGEGPSLWNNVFSAFLGTVGIAVLWFSLETLGRISSSVAVDRDIASGLRLAGFLIAVGLILGRSVAGDWHSAEDTVRDFVRQGWPALLITAVAALLERICRPSPTNPVPYWPGYGALPALAYLVAASASVTMLGPW
jgi:hypothetical protein